MWPNLLSLDAPLLAVVWQVMFARCFGAHVDAAQCAVLAMYVWLVYVADRALDGLRTGDSLHDTARHRFHRNNWPKLAPAFAIVAIAAAYMSLTCLGPALLRGYAWLAVAGAAYFALVHLRPARTVRRWPKELVVAILFAIGTCMPVLASGRYGGAVFAPVFALFAAALWINALGIECWEHARDRAARERLAPRPTRALGLHLEAAAWATCAAAATLALFHQGRADAWVIYASIAVTCAMLGVMDWQRGRLGGNAMRVLADAAFLTPLLMLAPLWLR
jgi:hypothetical protein